MMSSRTVGADKMLRRVDLHRVGQVRRSRCAGRCLLPKSFAKSFALLLVDRFLHASFSCLIAAHDGVRTRQIRDTKVEEGRKVRHQVARPEAHVSVVELVATVGVGPPGVRVARRDAESRAFMTGFVQAAEAPQERVAWRRILWV